MKTTTFSFSTLFFFLLVFNLGLSQEAEKNISGYITHFGEPLSGVKVSVVNTETEVLSDKDGRYEIKAQERATIAYSYPGMETIEIIVEDVTKVLNVSMYLKVNELEEVTVTERKLSRKDSLDIQYKFGKDVIKGAFGTLDKRSSALSISFVEEEEINRSFDLIDVVRKVAPSASPVFNDVGQLIGINISPRFCDFGGCDSAGFDIDGFLTLEFPFIPLDQIKRVAVINTPQFGVYGRFGSAGLIIINTKSGQFGKRGEGPDNPNYDYAKLRSNIFNDNAKPYSSLNNTESSYQKLLTAAATKVQVLAVYNEQSKFYGSLPDFHLDVANYFKNVLNDKKGYFDILESTSKKFSDNANVLKAIAYLYEASNKQDLASKIYEQVFRLRPTYAQSYRDLSNSYSNLGEDKEALGIIARYKRELFNKEDVNKSEIDSIISIEISSLVSSGKLELVKELKNETSKEVWPIRLVVEWNNSEAEFDLQLVHPEGNYYTWSHTTEKNKELLIDEKLKGYSSKQFYIDSDAQGEWKVNVNYFGNKSYEDTYLKTTVFYNYGSYNQTEKTFVYKLSTKNVNQNLLNLLTPVPLQLGKN